MNCITVR